jgi:beta-glucosidase
VEFEWEFGHGLSYTRFEYSPLRLNATAILPHQAISAAVEVTNIGTRPVSACRKP